MLELSNDLLIGRKVFMQIVTAYADLAIAKAKLTALRGDDA